MNRVFKVIWNRTKGCYVVVAETAKNMTKRSSLSVVFSKMVGTTAVAIMLTGVMMPTDALGAPITRGTGATAENDGGIAVGERTNARGDYSVAMGTDATVGKNDPSESESQNGIAIGHGATVSVNPATATPGITDKSGGIAIGHDATTKDINTIAIGTSTIGQGAQAVAIGRNARTIANNGVAIGNEARVQSTNGFALGNNARAGFDEANQLIGLDNDQAFGSNARAYGGSSMAFGNNAKASKGGAVAMGNGSQSRGEWGVAIGNGAKALAQGARAIGANSTADATNAAAMGWDSEATGASSIAIGETAKSTGTNSIAIGTGAKATGESTVGTNIPTSTVAIGQGAQALENGDVVIGRSAKSIVSTEHGNPGSGAVVMGADAASYGARGDVAIGASAETNVKIKNDGGTVNPKYAQGVAIGSTAKTYGTQSLALGADTRAIGNSSVAIGGDDIDMARTELETAVPQLAAGNGIKKSFNKEIEDKFAGTLGSAAINVKGKYANTAAIGDATTAIGTLSEAYGTGSTAIGINSLTKGVASTGIGIMARSWGTNSLALGTQVGAYGDRSSSIGDTNQVGLDMKDGSKSGKESAAVGSKNTIYGNQAYAIGAGNTIGSATVVTTTEANGSGAGADQDKITTVTAGTVKGNMSGAFGYKNSITADNSYAVGSNSNVSADGAMVLGNNASITAKNAVALGNNTKVDNEGAVALGTGSETAAAVATPSATINGTVHNFAGINPASTVSVGKTGMERTVTNVAAGRISATSTDAINGSQLHAVTSEMDKGVAYAGDVKSASATANQFTRKLGEQTNIVGGVTDPTKLSDNNIGVVSNGSDTLNVKLAKTLTGLDSVTAGNTTINNGGLTVDGKTYVTPNGINANNQKITNVADGSNPNDAVNYSQLQKAIGGTAKASSVKAKDTNVTVTEGTNAAGGKEYTVGLGDKITVGGTTAAHPVTVDGTTGHVTGLTNTDWDVDHPVAVFGRGATEDQLKKVNDKVNTNKSAIDKNAGDIANNKNDINKNKQDIADNKQNIAKNAGDIVNINKTLDKGLNFAGDTGAVSNRKLGDTVTVKGGATGTLSDGNIGVVSDGNGTLNVKLAKTLTGLDSVTAGNTKTDNNGLTVGGKTYVSPTGLNANNQKITNVANGSAPNDAVNYSQLQAAIGGTAKASTVKPKDANITVTEGTNANGGKEFTVGLGNKITVGTAHPVTVDGDAGHVTGLTNTDWDVDHPAAVSGRGATEDQLKKVNDKVNTNKTQIDKNKQDIADNKQNITNNAGNIAQNKQDISNINTKINKGLNFAGDTGTVSNRQLGDTVTVKGGATGTLSDGNIGVESDGNGTLNVKLAKTLAGLDSVTAGGTTINNGGLTVGGKNYVSSTGLNANDQKVTNVANGDVAANSKDAVNGGQLHAAKNELTTNINNAKTELINKGIRFDADNNSEKTNKLGSKVTVNGDDNITTEITQTGDDTKIGVKLNKNLNVQTLTATDTVKAGDVTVGKHADTKNYVTGLDNKDWDVNTSNPVSGRAATEDQLKKISDVIKNQGAASTDYRLVTNSAAADGAYTVDSNGDVDLTVEDKNHAGKKETVKIKDVASKSSLDKLNDRAVKYDLDNNGAVDKTKVTYEGPT
ncbi:MAG: Hep/Hag repeat protein, partial [Veillonella sp. DORA_B_18_19_23]